MEPTLGGLVGSGCGNPQELSGESGTFTSLNYPNSYNNNKSCVWHITVEPDKVVHLWFEDLALEDTKLCTADFITIKDTLGIIGKYCGYDKPQSAVSLGNRLTVYFDTNDRNTDKGFKAHYKSVSPESTAEIAGAGGSVEGDRGDLLTPGYPEQNYQNGALYQWHITVPEGERVRLTFTSFDLVPEDCGDFVEVFDGHKAGSETMGKFCGGKLPKPLETSGNTMVLRFKSDNTLTSKGFSATYTKTSLPPVIVPTTPRPSTTPRPTTPRPSTTPRPTTPRPSTPRPTTPRPSTTPWTSTTPRPTTTPMDSGCGGPGTLYGRKGVIQSLGFPNAYPAHLRCSWKIRVPEGLLVKLQITDMSITGWPGGCAEDKLIISDIYNTLGTHCGDILPPAVVSSNDLLSVSFQSDSRLTDRGFSAKWEAVYPEDIAEIQGCGMSTTAENGVIKFWDWPMNYKPNIECMWNIAVPVGKNITLNFTHFELEGSYSLTDCYDYVMIFDIRTKDGLLMKKHGPFCGNTLPTPIQTQGNRLLMCFHADDGVEAKGFRAYWSTDPDQPAPTDPPAPPNPWDDIPIEWPTTTCGRPAIRPFIYARIVNGQPAIPHSWPWQVSMQVWPFSHPEPSRTFHICGGTLIHKNWVLTAAHCFIDNADELQRWHMCLGKHNLTYTEPSERCFNVTGIYRHEGFDHTLSDVIEFDIALVRLDGEVTPSREISYACLPSVEEVLPGGKQCYASGWGDETGASEYTTLAESLNQVALPVVPYDTCKREDWWWFQVKTSMICSGYTLPDELSSTCQGDSGGPLVCQDTAGGPWEVHGITSFGHVGCIMNMKPSVFTRSSAYIPWIENVIRRDMYIEHTSGCGGPKDLTGTEGTLSSMGYPGTYSNEANCQWNIRAPTGKVVHLQFHNFSLEESPGLVCINDKVTLYDTTGSLGTYCSHTTPPREMVSDGEMLHIRFSSNDRVVDTGFIATWKAVPPSEAPCGGSFSTEQGEIISPDWPSDYPAQSVCTWRITIPGAKNIHVVFTHFEVQAVNRRGNCLDYVEIFNGDGIVSQGRFCGMSPPPLVNAQGNTAIVRFLSNRDNQQKGFRGYWAADTSVDPTLPPLPPNPRDNITISESWDNITSESWDNITIAPCGGSYSTEQGEIISPDWPRDYPAQSVCTWRITIPGAKNIHVVFTHFEVQAVNMLRNCVDYVEIFNGVAMVSQGRFCGFSPPPQVNVQGNTTVVRFLSNGDNQQKGFRGYWTTDASVFPTLPPPPPNPWDNITISWPEDCGTPAIQPNNNTLSVVNRVEAVPHSWPWQVSMQASPGSPFPYMHGCGGSLIHKEWILTAAHCFMVPLNVPGYWRMCLGKHHINSSMDVPSAEACYDVDGIIRHEGFVYEQDKTDITNDIALVHLAKPVTMTQEISPVCLPTPEATMPAGTPCYVTGWLGKNLGSLFPMVSGKLNQATLPVIDFPTCSKPAYWWDTLRPSMICAGYESPDELKSACQGDSGGPFACQASGSNTTWEVHGIVSVGPQGCIRDKKPSVFTRVSAFSDWIENNIKKFMYNING